MWSIFWFVFRARRKNHPEMKHLYLVHEMLLQKSKPFPVNSLVYSFVPAFHCSTRYHGKTDLILVISWSWDGNVSSLSSRARKPNQKNEPQETKYCMPNLLYTCNVRRGMQYWFLRVHSFWCPWSRAREPSPETQFVSKYNIDIK